MSIRKKVTIGVLAYLVLSALIYVLFDNEGLYLFGFIFAYTLVFGGLAFLIHRFAKEKVRKGLYVALAFFAAYTLMNIVLAHKDVNPSVIAVLCAIIGCLAGFAVYKVLTAITKDKEKLPEKNGEIPVLNGYHVYGLPANEGIKVSAYLYNDGIVFEGENDDILKVEKEDIVAASSRSEKEVVRTVTKGTTTGGLGTALTGGLIAGPAGLVAGAVIGKKNHRYTTVDKKKTNWYYALNTANGEIVIRVKSQYALFYFVDMCNTALNQNKTEPTSGE